MSSNDKTIGRGSATSKLSDHKSTKAREDDDEEEARRLIEDIVAFKRRR